MRFVNALVGEHKGVGLKSADEGLILLRCNSKLCVPHDDGGGGGGGGGIGWAWLDDITDALSD
jgi:hypothetical protein